MIYRADAQLGARWRTVAAIDMDAKACEVYLANFPGVPVQCCRVEHADLPAADVILAGFPCQPHSVAGERKAGADERDGGDAFIAAIERVRPRMFLGENVAGILSSEGGRYIARLVARMEALGYRVDVQTLDAVDFGVPQFRNRVWFWGIRSDVEAAHRWPTRTHMDPALRGDLFGDDLPPWVSCGEALRLTLYDAQNETEISEQRPCGTLMGNAQEKGGWAGHYAIHRARGESVERPDHPVDGPCCTIGDGSGGSGGVLRCVAQQSHADGARTIDVPAGTLRSGGKGHDSCCVRIIGAARGGDEQHAMPPRVLNDEPAQTIFDMSGGPRTSHPVIEYRYSDAMYHKHAPAAPAAPAPTVQAKWFKGGAEGLVGVETKQQRSRRRAGEPGPTLGVDLPDHTIFGEPVKWMRKGDAWMRRLSPLECARLQSVPDDFIWPQSVSKSARYRIIGNGVACGIAVPLSLALAQADPSSRTVLDLFCGGGLWACGWHGRCWSLPSSAIPAPPRERSEVPA